MQNMLVALSEGVHLAEDQKQLLHCDLWDKLEFSAIKDDSVCMLLHWLYYIEIILNVDYVQGNVEPFAMDTSNYDDDFDFAADMDFNDDDEDDETPLALRAKKKTRASSEPKRKRGRPRKDSLKVPPLRIKAVKPKKSVAFIGIPNANDNSNTQYEIRDGTEDPLVKGNNFCNIEF